MRWRRARGHRRHGAPRGRAARRRPDRRRRSRWRSCPTTTKASLAARLHAVEHRLLPRGVALPVAGALCVSRRPAGDRPRATPLAALPRRGGRCSRSPTRPAWSTSAGASTRSASSSCRPGARHGRCATRDSTSPTSRRDRLPGDARRPGQDAPPARSRPACWPTCGCPSIARSWRPPASSRSSSSSSTCIRFADAAARPGIDDRRADRGDRHRRADPGARRGQEPRERRHRHGSRRYARVIEELRADGPAVAMRPAVTLARRGVPADRGVRRDDRRRAARRFGRRRRRGEAAAGDEPGPAAAGLTLHLERVQALRYGENPHQAAALYRVPGTPDGGRTVRAAARAAPGQAAELQQPAGRAGRRGAGARPAWRRVVIVKHGNPCGAAEAADLSRRWDLALAGDPVSAYGGVAALTRPVDAALAERLTGLFLEVVVARPWTPRPRAGSSRGAEPAGPGRSALWAMLPVRRVRWSSAAPAARDPRHVIGCPAGRPVGLAGGHRRARRTTAELRDLDLAWRVCRPREVQRHRAGQGRQRSSASGRGR